MSDEPKLRYSDEELQEFKVIVEEKINKTNEELDYTKQQIRELNESGFAQQGGDWFDDSSVQQDLEMQQRILIRQQKYLQDLGNALLRIQNKTYGICVVTGSLIDKARLRAVPHATKSVDGKMQSNSKIMPIAAEPNTTYGQIIEENRGHTKPIGDKVRLPNVLNNRATNDDSWEPDNEHMEDAGYQKRKNDDDIE